MNRPELPWGYILVQNHDNSWSAKRPARVSVSFSTREEAIEDVWRNDNDDPWLAYVSTLEALLHERVGK